VGNAATLAEMVADALRHALRDGVYISGERLAEIGIAQEMCVSQNTVRDALHLLEREGWVIRRRRQGVTVRTFTGSEAAEVYALWSALERLALEWALEHITAEDLNRLEALLGEARLQAEMSNLRGMQEAIFKLHTAITASANKPQTAYLLSTLHNQVRLLENLRHQHDPRRRRECLALVSTYQNLLQHIAAGRGAAAGELLQQIIMNDCESLLPLLD
jgi:DNA-binding GntR family transcriptional regulator